MEENQTMYAKSSDLASSLKENDIDHVAFIIVPKQTAEIKAKYGKTFATISTNMEDRDAVEPEVTMVAGPPVPDQNGVPLLMTNDNGDYDPILFTQSVFMAWALWEMQARIVSVPSEEIVELLEGEHKQADKKGYLTRRVQNQGFGYDIQLVESNPKLLDEKYHKAYVRDLYEDLPAMHSTYLTRKILHGSGIPDFKEMFTGKDVNLIGAISSLDSYEGDLKPATVHITLAIATNGGVDGPLAKMVRDLPERRKISDEEAEKAVEELTSKLKSGEFKTMGDA